MRVCGVYFVFVILLSACTNGVSHLDIALQQAKHNKAELEKVLKHFKHDSLKYRAACFLIEICLVNIQYSLMIRWIDIRTF